MGDDDKVIWIDDCDDTLIHTTWKYEVAHLDACRIMLRYVQHHAPYMTELIRRRQKIDDDLVGKNGFVEGYFDEGKSFVWFDGSERVGCDGNIC